MKIIHLPTKGIVFKSKDGTPYYYNPITDQGKFTPFNLTDIMYLPDYWDMIESSQGSTYFYNNITGKSQYRLPDDAEVNKLEAVRDPFGDYINEIPILINQIPQMTENLIIFNKQKYNPTNIIGCDDSIGKQLTADNINKYIRKRIITQHKYPIISLNLVKCEINSETITLLSQLTNLETLNISDNPPDLTGIEIISKITSLKSLDIANIRLFYDGMLIIVTMSNLLTLNISNNPLGMIGPEIMSEHWRSIDKYAMGQEKGIKILVTMGNLTSLNVSNNYITLSSVKLIATMTNLTSLDISKNGIISRLVEIDPESDEVISTMTEVISTMTNLKILNISACNIYSGGAIDIATMHNLKILNISNNSILDISEVDDDLTYLAIEKIANMPNLTSLDISYQEGNLSEFDFVATLNHIKNLVT